MLPAQIIQRTLRVPAPAGEPGDGAVVARQLDAVLLGVGFAATRELLDHLSALRPDAAMDAAVTSSPRCASWWATTSSTTPTSATSPTACRRPWRSGSTAWSTRSPKATGPCSTEVAC